MTATLAPEARRSVSLFFSGDLGFAPKFAKKKDEKTNAVSLGVTDMPIFRSGTFRDSMGFQHTWEDLHLAQMVSNFELLKSRGYFPDPPVRKGHGSLFHDSMDGLIGYVNALRTEKKTSPIDGKEYTYILANFDILDADAQQKIENGLWRHKSAEIGFYLNNDDAEFWPVMMGFAYVDIPAVEGLNFSKMPGVGSTHSVMFEKEAPVTTSTGDTSQQNGNPATNGSGQTPPPAAPQQPAPHTFSVAGQPCSDYAAVQAHIKMLEEFRSETMTSARKNFVSQLAKDNKILASQVTELEEFALDLSDAQYSKWTKSFEAAPSMSLLGNQVQGTSNHSGTNGQQTAQEKQNEIDLGIIRQHQLAGMSADQISKTAAYGRLKLQSLV